MRIRDVLRMVQRALGAAWTSRRVQRALAQVPWELERLEGELRASEVTAPVSCRGRGCAACCRSDVPVFAHELPGILAAMPADAVDRVRANASRLVAGARRVPCPALDPTSGACTVYAARPATCRGYAVVSPAEWCDVEVSGVRDVATPVDRLVAVAAVGKRLGAGDTVSLYAAMVRAFGADS